MVLDTRSEGEVSGTFDAELVPHGDQIMSLVKLNLVGNKASAVLLVGSVLQVPAALLLLNKLANGQLVGGGNAVLDGAPNLQVLGGISGFIFAGALPGDEESTERGEAKLVDVEDGQAEDLGSSGGVNDRDSVGGSPAKVAAAGRVFTATKVTLRLCESRYSLVDRGGVKDTNCLQGAVGELQRGCHG